MKITKQGLIEHGCRRLTQQIDDIMNGHEVIEISEILENETINIRDRVDIAILMMTPRNQRIFARDCAAHTLGWSLYRPAIEQAINAVNAWLAGDITEDELVAVGRDRRHPGVYLQYVVYPTAHGAAQGTLNEAWSEAFFRSWEAQPTSATDEEKNERAVVMQNAELEWQFNRALELLGETADS